MQVLYVRSKLSLWACAVHTYSCVSLSAKHMAKLDMAEASAESESAITTADADTEGSQPSEVATGCFESCDTHSPLFQCHSHSRVTHIK